MEFLNLVAGAGYTVRGNPDLKPEGSTNFSIGAEWSGGSSFVRGSMYHNELDDFVETRLASDSSGISMFTYGNIATGWTRGGDVEVGVAT